MSVVVRRLAFMMLAMGCGAEAKLRSLSLSADQEIVAPRWMYDPSPKAKVPPVVEQLVLLKKAFIEKRSGDCVRMAHQLAKQAKGLKTWLAVTELRCALALATPEAKEINALEQVLGLVDQNPKWLVWGPQADTIRPLYVEGQVTRFERQVRIQRRQAWRAYDTLQEMRTSLSDDQQARIYRAAGELAFLEQNLILAIDMFSRSLDEKDSDDVRRRLEAIRATVINKKDDAAKFEMKAKEKNGKNGNGQPPLINDREREIFTRMQTSIDGGDLLSAIEDGIRLITHYPGSFAARWASDRILDIYLSLGAKGEPRYGALRERAVGKMLDADPARLARWANNAYVKGYYADAVKLAKAAVDKYNGHPDATKMVLVAANASHAIGDLGGAERSYLKLIEEHDGSEESHKALFRLALMRMKTQKWADASTYLERLLVAAAGSDWEYLALYWQWRAQQKLAGKEAEAVAEKLIAKYPLTYYGLRARAELAGGTLNSAPSQQPVVKSELWLSDSQSQAWERLQLLLKSGWFDEAQAEIKALPSPDSPEEQLIRARLLAAAFDHYQAIQLYSDTWSKNPQLFSWPMARSAFPMEYKNSVEREAKANHLDAALLRALMRQESSFRARVISPSNAHGVMQVLPATAQEVAQSQKWKSALVLPDDLFNPDLNIKVGTIYLGRLLKAYKYHVPLALASYNAGIGRLRKWLAARNDLDGLEERHSSAPEDEIWIDELPWEETSTYVKAVLRNLLMYRLFTTGQLKLANPVWAPLSP